MYNDRGLIKWAPFDSLVGFRTNIEQMLIERNKIEKPILSLDQINELNNQINQIDLGKTNVLIEYYEKGFIYQLTTTINKIEPAFKKLILKYRQELLIEQILYLEIIE